MPDYSKGLVYRIDCKETGECYIGSTVQGLANRIAEHRKKNTNIGKQKQVKKIAVLFLLLNVITLHMHLLNISLVII